MQRLRDLEVAVHPLEYLLTEVPASAAAGAMKANIEASLVGDMRSKTLLRTTDSAEVNPVRTPGARPTVKTVATPTQKQGMHSI